LRSALSFLTAETVTLEIDARGKPRCAHPCAPHFNLSHSGNWIAAAFCRDVPVGIDIEDPTRPVPFEALARRYFSPRECETVLREGAEAFFKIWTRKEARVKAEGHGLAHGKISSFDVEDLPGWNFHDFHTPNTIMGSLAYAGPLRPVIRRDTRGDLS